MENQIRQRLHDCYIKNDKKEMIKQFCPYFPKTLIKFQSGSTEHIQTLTNQKLWYSSPQNFNDPFDCLVNIDYRIMAKQVKKDSFLSLDQIESIAKTLNKHRDESIRNSIFVSCFSEASNLYSKCMWGHYANNHKGYCVEYDYFESCKATKDLLLPIAYRQNYSLDINAMSKIELYLALAFTKDTEWEYEKEWRLISINEQKQEEIGFSIDFIPVKAIYLGAKTDDILKNTLLQYCLSINIPCYQMELKPGTFQLKEHLLPNIK